MAIIQKIEDVCQQHANYTFTTFRPTSVLSTLPLLTSDTQCWRGVLQNTVWAVTHISHATKKWSSCDPVGLTGWCHPEVTLWGQQDAVTRRWPSGVDRMLSSQGDPVGLTGCCQPELTLWGQQDACQPEVTLWGWQDAVIQRWPCGVDRMLSTRGDPVGSTGCCHPKVTLWGWQNAVIPRWPGGVNRMLSSWQVDRMLSSRCDPVRLTGC